MTRFRDARTEHQNHGVSGAYHGAVAQTSRAPLHLSVVLDDLTGVGGAELLLLSIFRHFDPAVVRPKVICLREAGELADEFRSAGFEVGTLDRSGRFDLRTVPRLVRCFRRDGTDAVLVMHHHRASHTLGRIAARLARVSANLIAVHDMGLTQIGRRCLPRYTVETLFLSHALVLLAPSQGRYLQREEGVGRFPWRRIPETVIWNGIEIPPATSVSDRSRARQELRLAADDFIVGIVARLTDQKAHHVLFEAVRLLIPAHPCLRLVVVGDGRRGEELRELAVQLGIADQIRFVGQRRDVPALLPAFDVSCLSSMHEGAPIAVIESMAAGVPVVATDCGALRDMVADGEEGFIIPVGDAAALAGRLAALAADPALRASQGRRCRRRAEREYSIEGTVAGYQRLLTSLVAR